MKARHKDTGEIIELAEEGIISSDGRRFCWYQVELIPEPIDECKPSLPSNLDEAAEEYEKNKVHSISALGTNKDGFAYYMRTGTSFSDAFKAGAEFDAAQFVLVGGEPTGWFRANDGSEYATGLDLEDPIKLPVDFYVRKK